MKHLRSIQTEFIMSYPTMSLYEFDSFKEESEVLEFWKNSSIYIICQRPVLYFDEIFCNDATGIISMKIKQRGEDGQLSVKLSISSSDEDFPGECWVHIEFYDKEKQTKQPFRNAAGIKLLNNKKEFIVWLSPERLIFDYMTRAMGLDIEIEGDIHEFLTYRVHYIGQAQNQHIWDRLTRHEKLSKILMREHPFIQGEFSPYELSLIFLKFNGFSEVTMVDSSGSEDAKDVIDSNITDEEVARLIKPKKLESVRPFAINDFEAYLINLFEPQYNKILFNKYPSIKNGLKSIGYFHIEHQMSLLASLVTEQATFSIEIKPIYSE